MKELFNYTTDQVSGLPLVLSLQVGDGYAGFTISDKEGNRLSRAGYCTVGEWDEAGLLSFFNHYNLRDDFYSVQIAWNFSVVSLVPARYFRLENAAEIIKCVHGGAAAGSVIAEPVAQWQLQTTYVAPPALAAVVKNKLPAAKHYHLRTILLKRLTSEATGVLRVSFQTDLFTVLVAKEGKLLLAETYAYSSPDDVIFYLLKICKQFSLSQQDVWLQLCGLIDKQSALYRELYQYFMHVEFREAGWGETAYPAHFFTTFNDQVKCAL